MTSTYALYDTAKLQDRFELADGLPKGVKPNRSITPTMEGVVIVNRAEKCQAELMKWGLVSKGAKDTNSVFRYKTYNVPSEKMLSRHSWGTAVRHNRCLVPVNGFYEPATSQDKAQNRFIQLKDETLFALAGIYTEWEDPAGKTWGTYSILTIKENGAAGDRMPVIIAKADEVRWLDTTATDANALYDMIRSYPKDLLKISPSAPQ